MTPAPRREAQDEVPPAAEAGAMREGKPDASRIYARQFIAAIVLCCLSALAAGYLLHGWAGIFVAMAGFSGLAAIALFFAGLIVTGRSAR